MESPENQRIEKVRLWLKKSQKDFAESIGMKQPNYHKAIKEGNSISGKPIYLLSSVHRVDLDWIFGKIDSENPIFIEEKKEDNKVRELEQKVMKMQEELLEYKTRGRKIISKAAAILEHYKPQPPAKPKPDDYIFPLLRGLDKKQYEPRRWAKLLDAKNSILRKELMAIAAEIGVEKLSMHVARHTFANLARQATGDIYLVSDALDHSSVRITEGYFSDAEPEENDELVRKIFGE